MRNIWVDSQNMRGKPAIACQGMETNGKIALRNKSDSGEAFLMDTRTYYVYLCIYMYIYVYLCISMIIYVYL